MSAFCVHFRCYQKRSPLKMPVFALKVVVAPHGLPGTEAMDGVGLSHPCDLDYGNPRPNDGKDVLSTTNANSALKKGGKRGLLKISTIQSETQQPLSSGRGQCGGV